MPQVSADSLATKPGVMDKDASWLVTRDLDGAILGLLHVSVWRQNDSRRPSGVILDIDVDHDF